MCIAEGIIREIKYETNGCPSSYAAAGALCTLVQGRELAKAQLVTVDELILFVGGLPEGKRGAAERAIEALVSAEEIKDGE